MKRFVLIAMLVLATGCAKNAERTDTKGVGGFRVETLFTHDGCTVYRFEDMRTRYYAKCVNADATTMTTQPAGKSSFQENIPTSNVDY